MKNGEWQCPGNNGNKPRDPDVCFHCEWTASGPAGSFGPGKPLTASGRSSPEEYITLVARIILIGGIITAAVLVVIGLSVMSEEQDGLLYILLSIPVLAYSVTTWGLLKIIAHISITLTEIKHRIGED